METYDELYCKVLARSLIDYLAGDYPLIVRQFPTC